MDKHTLTVLIKEAKKNYRAYKKQFNKYDNSDDMHEMERWSATVDWLEEMLLK